MTKRAAASHRGKRRRPAISRRGARGRGRTSRRWSHRVMRSSNALDLEAGVFTHKSPRKMLNFHINRGGRGLSAERRRVLTQAKGEQRRAFAREAE